MRALNRNESEQVRRGLVAIADRLSEAFAAAVDENGMAEDDRQVKSLLEVNRELWLLRWEINLTGGSDAEMLEASRDAEVES